MSAADIDSLLSWIRTASEKIAAAGLRKDSEEENGANNTSEGICR